ncbi:hypothetical protein CAC42_644 [Sphaceloma murrayae]|uniref:Urease accessory protein UreF n=1 Tax=Sphaceloma murrayae TaxID=2082308 RepID=A0A2K1QJP7_9PEZI|nr:hypothetical protein CAC42_644 [Sphaceloma murrayae]
MPLHPLLLLSDSALPLGAFAFSSGLESYLAHTKATHQSPPSSSHQFKPSPDLLTTFLQHSLHNQASTTLPYLLAAWHHPSHLPSLDDILDASTPCTVARRASTAQGRALASLWTRALRAGAPASPAADAVDAYVATVTVSSYSPAARSDTKAALDALLCPAPQAHLPPLFGAVARAMGLTLDEAAYVYLLNHVKAVLSAAVRAGVMGPYQSQGILAGRDVEGSIWEVVEGVKRRGRRAGEGLSTGNEGKAKGKGGLSAEAAWALVEEAGVSVPPMDLWMGRHEVLYSRIFNS